jgi:hypothetical protein
MTEAQIKPKRPFQFRLMWLFVLTVFVALLSASFVVSSPIVGVAIVVTVIYLSASCSFVAAVYAKGLNRAYFLGSLPVLVMNAFFMTWLAILYLADISEAWPNNSPFGSFSLWGTFGDFDQAVFTYTAVLGLSSSVICGLAGLGVAWMMQDQEKP